MSGVGCFGTTIIRILAGSGYSPVWSSVFGFHMHPQSFILQPSKETPQTHNTNAFHFDINNNNNINMNRGNEARDANNAACLFGNTPNVLRQMAGKVNRYNAMQCSSVYFAAKLFYDDTSKPPALTLI